MQLDADQQKVVAIDRGYHAVLAGAGSGKSTVLLHRTGRLYRGELPREVVCVTFTSEAAKNLRTRAVKMFPHIDSGVFCTLHSLALKFAIQHPNVFPFHLAENPLADEGLSARAVYDAIGDRINFRAFTTWVSLQKRNRVAPDQAMLKAINTGKQIDYATGYIKYQALLKKQGILDFDDLIYFMVQILEKRPDIRSIWQYQYVMQDEAQDACELDWKLLQLITERHQNLLCVGDSGQALYGFRGGAAKHLLNMNEMFPGTTKHILGTNYRSLPGIVEAGKKAYLYPEIATHFKPFRDGLATVSVIPYSNQDREAEECISTASLFKLEETAILARTNLALRAFEEECLNQDVQYYLLGESGFWESPEVENVLKYVRCLASPTDHAIMGAIQTPFWPTKFVKKKLAVQNIKTYVAKGHSAYGALDYISELQQFKHFIKHELHVKSYNAGDAVGDIIWKLKALDYYKEESNINPDRNPVSNLYELAKAAKRFDNLKDFLDFIRRLEHMRKKRKGLCLSTIHQAKGKEWKNVFLVSVNQGILPHSKAVDDLEGERCCFFVGVSRAEDFLRISYYDTPSIFLHPFLREENEDLQKMREGVSSNH